MRTKTIFGALLVSVALCSQGFSFELLDRMLGLNGGGCGECKACAKVACCEKACPKACCCPEPACCEKACPKVCAKACCDPACCDNGCCGKCKKCRATPVRDLFGGLKDLFEAKGCYCETNCCEAAKGCCPEPACCAKPHCCEKACCEPACCEPCCKMKKCHKQRCAKACDACCPVKACEPACEPTCQPKCHKLYRRPVIELLDSMFGKKCCCGGNECCEAGCGCGGTAPVTAPAKTPAKAPEQAAPLPQAPKADPSAAVPSRGIYQASRTLVRN